MTQKSEIFAKKVLILAVLRGDFRPFAGQLSRFLDFFKVVEELFKKFLNIVFGIKR